ncbi:MAG: TadE/TadG family type IV pilus assembly protein [Hyphomicrobium sp.]
MRSLRLRGLARDEHGVILLKFALFLPILFSAMGMVMDLSRYMADQSAMQQAVDAAALAAAKELSLSDRKYENLEGIAEATIAAYLTGNHRINSTAKPIVKTVVTQDPVEVSVTASLDYTFAMGQFTGLGTAPISTRAVAMVIGKPNICVLGLNPDEGGTISLEQDARVTGKNCAVYSNSSHNNGLKSKNDASMTAAVICSRGGREGGPGNFSPEPLIDCPSFDDPLASRPEPTADPCDSKLPTTVTSAIELEPGTYCGLDIKSGGNVTLREGVFIFKDLPLRVRDGGTLTGEGVGLYFTGANANFKFDRQSTISLSAPTSGPMAGLLVFAGRSQSSSLQYEILSDDARVMVGTIYIPSGELRIDATNPIADNSAYTAIVADKMRLYGGPHLILNTNYNNTEVPVPDGIRGAGQPVALTR